MNSSSILTYATLGLAALGNPARGNQATLPLLDVTWRDTTAISKTVEADSYQLQRESLTPFGVEEEKHADFSFSVNSSGDLELSDGRKLSRAELSALLKNNLEDASIQLHAVSSSGQLTPVASISAANVEKNYLGLWSGIVGCLVTSATLSGLTLGLFSLSRMNLEILSKQGDQAATQILKLREDSNTLLATCMGKCRR